MYLHMENKNLASVLLLWQVAHLGTVVIFQTTILLTLLELQRNSLRSRIWDIGNPKKYHDLSKLIFIVCMRETSVKLSCNFHSYSCLLIFFI